MRFLLLALVVLCAWGTASCDRNDASGNRREVMVFAAASLRDSLEEIRRKFSAKRPKVELVFNFAGSNTLARQLLAKPAANVFVSANEGWMNRLEEAGRLVPKSRHNLLANRLAFVVKADSKLTWPGATKLATFDYRHLVMGDPSAVPAGMYARSYLESLRTDGGAHSLWQRVEDRVLPMPDVRAALRVVERDPKSMAIVYETDALVSPGVRTLYVVPADGGPPIRYPAALLKGKNSEAAGEFFDFLNSSQAKTVFRKYGFVIPTPVQRVGE